MFALFQVDLTLIIFHFEVNRIAIWLLPLIVLTHVVNSILKIFRAPKTSLIVSETSYLDGSSICQLTAPASRSPTA